MIRLAKRLLTAIDGGTLAFPTPEEADHGKVPWPHVSSEGYRSYMNADLRPGRSKCLSPLATLHSGPAESRALSYSMSQVHS